MLQRHNLGWEHRPNRITWQHLERDAVAVAVTAVVIVAAVVVGADAAVDIATVAADAVVTATERLISMRTMLIQ